MTTTSYINAPATKMLASHCAVCGRPLCDAKSVELGIGPICRRDHGYEKADQDVDPTAALAVITALASTLPADVAADVIDDRVCDARTAANRVVYRIALDQRKCAATDRMIEAVRALGFSKLADRIAKRLALPKPKPVSVDKLRAKYRAALEGLTYDNASKADVKAAVARELHAMGDEGGWDLDHQATPFEYVTAIGRVHCTCRACNGTGSRRYGRKSYPCARCKGRSWQDASDGHRNRTFDAHRNREARA